ncbi:MAG: ATP-binding protein [Gaiellaceae bacterium]
MRVDLPGGTVTFLFTDVEGSTRLLHELGAEAYGHALAEHRHLIREACTAQGGVEVDTQGDAFFFAFPTAPGALAAASGLAEALANGRVQVRVGVHTGTPLLTEEGYIGDDVHRAARIAASGHGGQVLVSASTAILVETELTDLGEHRFKDLSAPERVFQLGDLEFPKLKSLYQTNLPVPATPFLGREHELERVVSLLARDDVRLCTLTGPGGTGKTRLAVQAAAEVAELFPDGIFWVPLAPLRDPGLVLATVAEVMEFREQAGKSPLESLAAALAGKSMLLVLDNAEHLLPALASDVAALGASVPTMTLVVTSRERLRIAREHAFPVPTLADEDAVRLFHARARAVDPTFSSNGAVRQLCERLDNLPLALELAAARTGLLSPEQLLERLGGRLDFLTGDRDADPRQQTLRATIAWSHDLLSTDEQQAFARMSVFARGCTLGAAEEICASDLDTLQSLLDKSLIRRREAESEPRLWMLETIREFAAERLAASGEAERIARHHLAYYLAFAEDVDERRKVGEYELGRLEEERDNLRSAFDTALALDPEQALELAGRLGLYWNRRGHYREGRQRLAAALAAAPAAQATARARALSEAGNLAFWQTDLDAAEQLGREALALAREHSDRSGSGYALNLLGMIAHDPAVAVEHYEESLAEYEAAGDENGRLTAVQNLAANALARGDNQRAISLLRERVAGTRGRNTYSLALAIGLLGFALAANGETEEARQSFEESLEICRVHGFSRGEAEVLGGLADLMRTTSPARALEYYRESIELAWEMGYLAQVAECLRGIAVIALAGGDAREAATLLGVFAAFVERIGAILSPAEKEALDATIAQAREALGNDAFDAAWAEGGGLSLDQAVELALSVTAIEPLEAH